MSLIQSITIQTTALPDVTIDPNGPSSWIAQVLKPKITAQTAVGPVILAPYGDPGPTKFPGLLAGAVIGLLIGILIWRLA